MNSTVDVSTVGASWSPAQTGVAHDNARADALRICLEHVAADKESLAALAPARCALNSADCFCCAAAKAKGLPTAFMRGRCGIAAYDQIGFMDLVARDPAHYVELAVRVANDAPYRSHCVDAIRAGHDRLFERQSVIDEFNDFFASAYGASFTKGSLA